MIKPPVFSLKYPEGRKYPGISLEFPAYTLEHGLILWVFNWVQDRYRYNHKESVYTTAKRNRILRTYYD